MGIFDTIWDCIKSAAKGVYNFFKKIFAYVFDKVKFVTTLISGIISILQNNWFGAIVSGVKLIYELVKFFRSKGAKVDESYKDKLQDMQYDNVGEHQFNINVSP